MQPISTTLLPLTSLTKNEGQIEGLPANPRFIKDDKYRKLIESIRENPEMLSLRELLVYKHGEQYIIIGGNMRYSALQELGYTEAPCKVIPADATIEQLRAYTLKDNSGYGEWDWDLLANDWDMDELNAAGIDTPMDWDLFGEDKETEDGSEEDNFDEEKEPIETRCKKGDIWQLGQHRLMLGDSTDSEQVAKLMNGELADMFVTDPPYGVSYTEKNEFLNSIDASQRLTNAIQNDNKTPQEMYKFWCLAFKQGFDFTKEVMSYYVTAPQGGDLLLLLQALRDSGFMLKHQMVWNKNNHVLGRCDYNYKHEPIIYGWKIKGTHKFYGKGQHLTSVWDIPKPLKSDLHPTMKPIALMENMLLNNSQEGESVLDLFGGSGTTLIAAEQQNRKCFMMELDPHYGDVIIARWEKLTGKTAVRLVEGTVLPAE